MGTYQVTVDNLGAVTDTDQLKEALISFKEYKDLSRAEYGRAAGESVILWKHGEPHFEYFGRRAYESI